MKSTLSSICFLVISIFAITCQPNQESQSIPFEVIENPNRSSLRFQLADEISYRQAYDKAAKRYIELLNQVDLGLTDSLYAINQIAFCYLTLDKDKEAKSWVELADRLYSQLDSVLASLQIDYSYNKSRFFYLTYQQDSALVYIWRCNGLLKKLTHSHLLKNLQCVSLLGLIHYENYLFNDSTIFYAAKAREFLIRNPELQPYSAESNFVLSGASLLYRAHVRGSNYAKNALNKLSKMPSHSKLLEARCWNLLGNLLKKQGDAKARMDNTAAAVEKNKLYKEADLKCFQKAIELATQINHGRIREFWRDRVILASRYKDPKCFFDYLSQLNELKVSKVNRYGYTNRLLGYYYFTRNHPDSSMYYYQLFIEIQKQQKAVKTQLLDEAYFLLRELNKLKGDYIKALEYAELRGNLFACNAKLNKIAPLILSDSARTACVVNYYYRSKLLFEQLFVTNNLKECDLVILNQYFNEITNNFFTSILGADEDAILSFQLETGTEIFQSALHVAIATWKYTNDDFWLNKAFQYMEQMKSYLLYRNSISPISPYQETFALSDSIQKYQGKVAMFNYLVGNSLEKSDISDWFNTQALLSEFVDNYSSKFADELFKKSADINIIQSNLSQNQAFLEFTKSVDGWYGLFISPSEKKLFFISNSDNLESLIDNFKRTLDRKNYRRSIQKEFLSNASDLYEILIQPIEKELLEISQLIIVPDQKLNGLPFEALLTEKIVNKGDPDYSDLPYLLNRTEIIYSPSWKIYNNNLKKLSKSTVFSSFGIWINNEFKDQSAQILENIRKFSSQKTKITEYSNGKKQSFYDHHGEYDLIHITQHATSSETDYLDNQLLFGPKESDKLMGFELSKYTFNAKLIVLSACKTNFGVYQTGEGTFNLTRAFLQAGIPTVISTLWNVKQEPTDQIISLFYQFLYEGKSPSEALRLAKLSYLGFQTENKTLYAYPGYWAGVVLTK